MSVINYLMSFPRLYTAVQNIIAGPVHREVKASLIQELPDESGMEILDLGCGIGDYSILFNYATYTGLDLDENYIRSAKENYGRRGVKFLAADATSIPFPDGRFDYCFSVGLFHHLSDEAVVSSLHEVLRVAGSGRVIIMDAIYPPRGNYLGYILRRLDRGKFVRTFAAYEKLLRGQFPIQEISARRAGFLDYIYFRL